jgi:hypothetical protein
MLWLYEQPLAIVALGVALILALGAAWSASGRKELLIACGVAFVLLVAGLIVEKVVVTDREAVRATVLQIARDVQHNDRRAVLAHIHSGSPQLRKQAEAELPKYQFTELRITKIHLIDVDRQAEPRSAIVEFNVIGSGSERGGIGGGIPVEHIAQWVKLHMLREKDGRWTVADYEHDSPERMIVNR